MKPTTDVTDLLLKVFPPAVTGSRECAPFIAAVMPLADDETAVGQSMWATVHSVTSTELHLSHGQPLAAARVAVCVGTSGGEVLRIIVEIVSTASIGSLFETVARFLR